MPAPFDRFIVLADMRTGSNFLEANLNAIPGVACHGEAFNPHFIGKKDQTELFGISMHQREDDPLALIRAMDAATEGLAGFRFFHDHDPRVLAACLADRRCAKVVLTRNPLESYVSLKIARATGQWKLGDARRRREAQARFNAEEFQNHVAQLQEFQLHILRALQTSGQTAFYIGYEDVGDLEVLNGLAAFLGVPDRLEAIDDRVKKQNPEPLEDLVENPAEMAAGLARMDRFNLGRTPNFEPRRGAGVPGWVAACGAPLLYLPLKGGPEAQVRGWLASLGATPGLLEGFTQKTLKHWQKSNPGARSFTVLRHPLLRAHAAFCDRILSGSAGEVRGILKRAWKIDLPPPDRLDRLTPDQQAEAFLKFLGFLRGNLAGQTSVRVDASWASQTAVVQGFAAQLPPDALIREDRLAEGLAWLAQETGASCPPLPPAPALIGHPLAAIITPDHEATAREAYARDYQMFGFGDWRG
ncbi:MAG: nodulation protein NodH [Gemmobacter sp.]|nr:nodulation protein NodH [Gemmobacter sp.]